MSVMSWESGLASARRLSLADIQDLEAGFAKRGGVEAVAGVEDQRRLAHGGVDPAPVEGGIVPPVGHQDDRVGVGRRLVFVGLVGDVRDAGQVAPRVVERLRVGDCDFRVLLGEEPHDRPGRGLARVAGVGLEGEAEDGDFPVGEGVEHGAKQARDDALLLVVVHPDDAVPILRRRVQAEGFAEIDQVQDVLLETAAAEAGPRLEELRPDAHVGADDARHLVNVRAGRLAEARDGVYRRDPLREEGVRRELRQLGRPDVGGEDAVARHPGGVDVHHRLDGLLAVGGLRAANQNAVRIHQVANGRSLRKEFGVAEDGELVGGAVVENRVHRGGGADGEGGFLDDDLVAAGELPDGARRRLPVLEVAGAAGAAAEGLRGRVDAHEDDVALAHRARDVGAEEEVFAAHLADDIDKPRLVDGQLEVGRVPRRDARGVDVNDHDLAVGVHLGDYRHRRPADVAGPNADYVLVHFGSSVDSRCADSGRSVLLLEEIAVGDDLEVGVVDAVAGLHHDALALVAAQRPALGEGEGLVHRGEPVEKGEVGFEHLHVRDFKACAEDAAALGDEALQAALMQEGVAGVVGWQVTVDLEIDGQIAGPELVASGDDAPALAGHRGDGEPLGVGYRVARRDFSD